MKVLPRSLKPFLAMIVLLFAWSVVDRLVAYQLDIGIALGAPPMPLQGAIVAGHIWLLRWAPFLIAPALLAPMGATGFWLLNNWRGWTSVPLVAAANHLRVWLTVWTGLVAILVILYVTRTRSHTVPTGVLLILLAAFGWSYGGALYNALWTQKARHESGLSRLSGTAVAWTTFVIVNFIPIMLLGVGLPLWVAWASRHERKAG